MENWDRPPGTADARTAPRSRFTQLLSPGSSSPHLPTSSATGLSRNKSVPGFPRQGTRGSARGSPLVPPLLGRDPAILLPFAEKPPIYRSFSPRSFLLRRTPDFPAPKRSPTLARFQDPLLPSGDLPFTLSSPPGDPQFTHAHPSSDSHVFPPACLWPRSLSSSRGAGGWGRGKPPLLPPSGSGDPSHLRGERCVY